MGDQVLLRGQGKTNRRPISSRYRVGAHLRRLFHLCVRLTLMFEYRVPAWNSHVYQRHENGARLLEPLTEARRPSGWYNLAWRPALKESRLLPWTGRKCESAHCDGRFIFVGGEEVVQACMAQGVEEPFTVVNQQSVSSYVYEVRPKVEAPRLNGGCG